MSLGTATKMNAINFLLEKKPVFFLSFLFILFSVFTLTPWIHGTDGVGYYVYVRSLIIDKDLDLSNEYKYYEQIFPEINYAVDEQGRYSNQYWIGTPLLWLPFFLIGHVFAVLFSNPNGYSLPYVFLISLGSALYGFIGVLLSRKIAERYASSFSSTLAALVVWLASPLFYYMFLDPSMSHAVSAFAVTLFIFYWFLTRENRAMQQWIVLGFLGALMTLVRPLDGFFMLLPFMEVVLQYKKKLDTVLLKKNVLFLLALVLGLGVQLLVWRQLGGVRTYTFFIFDFAQTPFFLRILFSSNHGIFYWSPVLLLGAVGWYWLGKKDRFVGVSFLILFLVQVFLYNAWPDWWGAASFGHRMFVNSTPLFIVGLAVFMDKIKARKWVVLGSLLFILWNFGLMIQYGARMIPIEGTIRFATLLKNNIVEVPKKIVSILVDFINSRFAPKH